MFPVDITFIEMVLYTITRSNMDLTPLTMLQVKMLSMVIDTVMIKILQPQLMSIDIEDNSKTLHLTIRMTQLFY